MSNPATLKDLAEQRLTDCTAALAARQAELAAALADDKQADEESRSAARQRFAAGQALAEVHRDLAAATTPGEAAALAVELKTKTLAEREASVGAALKELARGRTAAALAAAEAALRTARDAQEQAQRAHAAALAAHQRRSAALAALGEAPLKDLPQAATAALAADPYLSARNRLQAALPEKLRERARERAAAAAGAVAAWGAPLKLAGQTADALREESTLPADKLPRLKQALADADDALFAYCNSAPADLDAALATLKRLADLTHDPLSPDQAAQLEDADGKRAEAADKEKSRDDAALTLAQAAAALFAARNRALAADPAGDPAAMEQDKDAWPDLWQARSDFDDATDAFNDAETDFTAEQRQRLAAWAAEVPESLWVEWSHFIHAEATLQALTSPPTLGGALASAQSALIAALMAEAQRQERLERAALAIAEAEALTAALTRRSEGLPGSALRSELALAPLLAP